MTDTKKCQYCDKRGLPILLIRDAVAQAGKGAPLANEAPIELEAAAAHYTKRLLRSGYVNVYDEARKRWELYFVTAQGHYFKLLLPRPGITAIVPEKPFNCPDKGHSELASCITVSDPKHATKVWIGFSDVLWTDAVRTANESAAYRKRHMVEIDVQAALAGATQPHARPIAQLPALLAEYTMNPRVAKLALGWSPYGLSLRQGAAQSLIETFDAMRAGRGLMVTLPDPAGIAAELAKLMKHSLDTFMKGPNFERNLAANAAITQLELAIKKQGEINEIDSAEQLANDRAQANPLGQLLSASERDQTEKMRHVTSPEAKRNAEESWKKYAKKFDNKARTEWMTGFEEKLKAFDKTFIAPLAKNHVSLMKSLQMESYLQCNYDPDSIDSGLVYTNVVKNCIKDTQDKMACSLLYEELLSGDIAEKNNFILRGMVFNLKKVINSIKSATTVNLSWKQIPWDNIFSIYTKAVERVSKNSLEVSSNFLVHLVGPIAKMIAKVIEGTPKFRAAIMATGLISGHPVIICDVVGPRIDFRKYLVKALQESSGQTVSPKQLSKAISDELKLLNVHGTPMNGQATKRWIVLADTEMLKDIPPGLPPSERAKRMASTLRNVNSLEELNLQRWRQIITNKLGFGIIAGVLQAICLSKLIEDDEKALASSSMDARLRMYAGMGAVAATTADVLGDLVEKRAAQGLRFGQGLVSNAGSIIGKIGSRGAIFLGLSVAVLDVVQARDAFKEGQIGLGALYITSAVLGGMATLAFAGLGLLGTLALPWIIAILVALVAVAIIIEYFKDNPVQDWLERCPWGVLAEERYPDSATEQAELAKALK